MNKYLLDSNAVNQFIDHRPIFQDRVRKAKLRGDRIGTCEPVVAEMYFGLEFSSSKELNIQRLKIALRELRSWPFDRAAAEEYGRVSAELERIGRKMQTIDMMIAAIALSMGDTVVISSDSDMLAIPGLPVENWATAP